MDRLAGSPIIASILVQCPPRRNPVETGMTRHVVDSRRSEGAIAELPQWTDERVVGLHPSTAGRNCRTHLPSRPDVLPIWLIAGAGEDIDHPVSKDHETRARGSRPHSNDHSCLSLRAPVSAFTPNPRPSGA